MTTQEKVKEAQRLRKTMSLEQACKQVGLGVSGFYYHLSVAKKGTPKRTRRRFKRLELENTQPVGSGRVFAVMGSPEDVTKTLRLMS